MARIISLDTRIFEASSYHFIGIAPNPNGSRSTYLYSADGLRRKREETGISRLEVWDGTQLLHEKDSSTKAEVARYLLQNDAYNGLRAQRLASDNTWRFFGYDLQGSTRLLLNSDGSSNLSLLYRAFGQKQASSGSSSTLMQFGAFYGYEWDADSRMWVKARHLSGTQGRWLSVDPIGFDGGDWNLWRYVGNNPVRWADSYGLQQPTPKPPKPYTEGPVPPNLKPLDTGQTMCNPDPTKGGVYIYIVGRLCPLPTFKCVLKHEKIHAGFMKDCCSRYRKCYQRAGNNTAARQKCDKAFIDWSNAGYDWEECRAIQASLVCLEALVAEYKCPMAKNREEFNNLQANLTLTIECANILDELLIHKEGKDNFCNKPGASNQNYPVPCSTVFRADGTLIPSSGGKPSGGKK